MDAAALRRAALWVAAINLAYFLLQFVVAIALDSISLVADSIDFFEDAAVNLLIALAVGWSLAARARMGRFMAILILVPSAWAAWLAFQKFVAAEVNNLEAPEPSLMIAIAAGGAIANVLCMRILLRTRKQTGSMGKAAWLATRNDVVVNLAIIVAALITLFWFESGWPDLILGVLILTLNLDAAFQIWRAAHNESLSQQAVS